MSSKDALEALKKGNQRYVSGHSRRRSHISRATHGELIAAQEPFAVVLGCSDSRVSPEIVFDQGPGDLFVVRVAGNIVTRSLLGSIEFATGQFGMGLVVVLGHTGCGAVAATIEELGAPAENMSPNLRTITDSISASIESFCETGSRVDAERAVQANVRNSVNRIRSESEPVERLVASGALQIVGAVYCLKSGAVHFLDSES